MDTYLNLLSRTESKKLLFIPDSGFPPIYECQGNKKKREYYGKSNITVTEILRERRNVDPFLELKKK